MTVLIAGGDDVDLDALAAAVEGVAEYRRAGTMAELRERLPGCTVVAVGPLPDATPTTVRELVRSGAYCSPATPVVRLALGPGSRSGTASDAETVAADQPDELRRTVQPLQRAVRYRGVVDELYERCRAVATGDADPAAVSAALERADEALADLRSVTSAPYERVLFGDEAPLGLAGVEPADIDREGDDDTAQSNPNGS